METLLERAKGSELDIILPNSDAPLGAITQLSPHTQQIGSPQFVLSQLSDVVAFSEVVSGPLPLLRTLKVASPMLRTVKVKISVGITLESVPLGLVVVLPNAETFSLSVYQGAGTHFYDIVTTRISCPHVRHAPLTNNLFNTWMTTGLDIFPTSVSWNTILNQFATGPIEEVSFEITHLKDGITTCSLTFRSSHMSFVTLGFKICKFDTSAIWP